MTTLGRQLLLGVSVIFLAGLLGIGVIYVINARLFLQEQLDSHSQDAATSLGLSLGARPSQDDPAFVETTINALFDRGHYERISFTDVNGKVLVDKRLAAAEEADVPVWFTKVLPLTAPTATSLVSQGWRQLGRITVTSHPRLAYGQLWRTGIETISWLAFIYVLALAAMRTFLRGLLRPLTQIERTAQAVAGRDYRRIDLVPRARELRMVVEAMNTLSAKVREAIEAETARAEQFHREAFLDTVTRIWNRRGMLQQFESRITDDRDVFSGTLLLVELHDFAGYNREQGYERGDEALRLVAGAIEEWSSGRGAIAGRWAGASFVAIAPDAGPADAQEMADELCRRIEPRLADQGLSQAIRFNCGAASFDAGKPEMSALLAVADGALAQAQVQGSGLAHAAVLDAGEAAAGSMDWRERLTTGLAEGRIALYQQAALTLPGRAVLHREVMTRLLDENGQAIPAARFVPMAARHGLVQALDRAMLQRLLATLRTGAARDAAVAVNVSPSSASDTAFVRWLKTQLDADRALAARLSFELAEAGVTRSVESAEAFSATVRASGSRFAVDGFGVHRDSLQLLKRLLPDYVKLSASHTATVATDASSRFFVESVIRIARSLQIDVIAQAVEKDDLVPLLVELGFAGYQGYAGGLPQPLE